MEPEIYTLPWVSRWRGTLAYECLRTYDPRVSTLVARSSVANNFTNLNL